MALQFTTTSQAAQMNGVKLLVYGGAGMGKTLMAATAPAPIVLSAESGLLSLSRKNIEKVYKANTPGISYDIPVIQINNVNDLTEAYNWMANSQEARQFATFCLDSISEIGEQVLNNAKRQVKDPRQAYGELIEKMETTIRSFRDVPGFNVYMSAKMEPTKDELTGVVKYGPSMPGSKLGPKLPYFFDEVFRLGINKDQQGQTYRFLQTQPEMQYDAKDRSGLLDPLEPPHLGHIFAKASGQY